MATVAGIEGLVKGLNAKKTFVASCAGLKEICDQGEETLTPDVLKSLEAAGKRAFTVLQTRHSGTNPKFWQAGLELFLAFECEISSAPDAVNWREAAMAEVDEDVREKAHLEKARLKLEWERKHNQGHFSDSAMPVSQAELAAAEGFILVPSDDGKPAMSREARDELRLVTVKEEQSCVICMETMTAGMKAKAMPCGHLFHDECLLSWVSKHNSCPSCRDDSMPSEKQQFDDVERRLLASNPGDRGLYA